MREIKFRAWDKKKKRWIADRGGDYICVGFSGTPGDVIILQKFRQGGDGYWHPWKPQLLTEEEINNLEIVQFTGLLDRKGVDIYEGDILADTSFDYDHTHIADCFNNKKVQICDPYYRSYYEVIFEKGEFVTNPYETYSFKKFPVVGNIYENPGLLESRENE